MIQIALFAVVFVLFLLAIIPRILFYAVSWRLRQVLPCAINYSRLSFRGAYLVKISFLTGDSIEVDRVGLTSWLLDSRASSLLCILVSCIHFYTSPDGLVKIWYLTKCAERSPTDKPRKSFSFDVALLKWCSLVVQSCWIHLSYTRTKSINPPQICTLKSHKALTSLMLKDVIICSHRQKHEMSIRAESVVLKPLIRAICMSGDEFTCQHCGETHSEADDDSSLSSNTRCLFCRRFHMCGTFVALLSTAVELRVGMQDGSVSVKVFGTFLMSRESNLWQFEKIIGAEVGLPLEVMAEKPSQSMRWSVTCLSIEFLPPRLSKSKLAVNLNLLRQPIERSLTLTSDMIRFMSGAENLIFSVGNLRLLSGRIDGTHEASRELMIERMDVCASLAEDKVDASLTVCGVFGGFAQDADESAFFQSLYSGLCSIEKSHSWLAPSHKTSYTSSYIKKMEQKCIHLSVHVEPSRNQEDCAARVAWLAAANVVPALVESIGSTKLDVTLPSAATESFSFVFETNGFHLDAIEPKWGSTGNSDFTWEPWKAKEDSFTPSPISDVLTEAESKCRLVEVAQFSTWRHANVVGFRIYEVEVEMPSVMLANMHRHLARAVAAVGGDACGGERERWSGWFRRRWFSTVATTSMNQLTLDGHFEAFRLAFLASCGARIECKVSRAHCSASALPRCSPSRTPLSSAATTASLMQQQQQSSMPSPLFLEFAVSSSDFHLRSPDTSTSSMPPTILVALPAFQVCCSLSQRSMDVSLCEPVELRIDPGAHLCVVELLLLTRRLLRIRRPAETVDTVTSSSAPMSTPWNVGVRNTATTRLNYSSGCHSASMVFSGMDVYVSSTSSHLSLRVNSSKLALLCDGREIAVLQNFVLRRLPLSGAHRKVAFQLTTPENTCLEIQSESTRFTFPFNYNFYACFDEFLNVRRAIKYAKSANSPFFAEVKAMEDGAGAVAPSKSTPPSGLPCDLVFRVKKFTLEIKDDPFECKLSDDFMVLMDESVEQQKRVAALVSQLERSRRSHGAPQSSAMAAAELQTCIEQLEFQRAAEYIARIRRFYSGYTMADDLFTWRMETACLHILTDDAFISPQKVIKEIQRLDDVSPWNNLQPSDFSQLCCRRVHLAVGRFQWQLRDYSKPLVDATELTLTGSFAVATRRSMDRRSQRDCKVNLIPIWQPSSINVVRYVSPTKFFYELFADVKEMSLCYGSNWEPTIAWLNLRLDDIRRASVDPSTPPLGWWDRVRLSYHGRLGFTCARFSWLYSTSLDPYNAHEFLTCQWTTCTFDWIPGHIFVNGDLDLFFQTASKYDGVCHVLQIPGLNFEVSMDWLSFGNQFDHHSVMPVNGERLTADELAHDSYAAFRGNRLLLGLVFSVNDVSTTQPPRCFIYTNLLKLFDRLKMCLSRISRPIRRGAVFNRIRPRKPFFGQLLQSLGVSVRMPCLEVTYWVSYNRRLGVHACCGALDLHSTFSVHVEGEREARTSVGAVAFILPSCNPQRRIAPQWSLQRVDARILNCRAWLLDRPDRTALHLISGADGSSFDQDSLLTSFPPNSELLIFSSIRFERELRSQMDMPVQPVRVRIPGLEGFNEEAKEDTGPVETEDTKSSVNEDSSSVSPERRHTPKIQLSHEDLEPVHRVMVENPKMRWNETNRNLVYTMMNMYNHAQTLKKNLSAQALKGISLDIANGPTIPSLSSSQSRNEGDRASISSRDNGAEPSKASVCIDAGTLTEEGKVNEHSPTSLCMNAMGPDAWSEVPMLAKLVKEAETAKFYAYCEEEPKQPNVLDQLQGLSLCTSSPVLSRQWHIELSNCQVMLKPNDCAGYVIVSAAKARLDSVEHPPVWRDARLLSKSSLIGQMECMQYYATVSGGGGDLEASTPDQWLSSADVRDWQRLGADFGQDALSGRPEVVGSGHAVGGIVSAAPSTTTSTSVTAIQLQRMVSRCACQFVYVTYAPLVPTSLPPGQFVPPLPPSEDDSKILQSQEGADTFTLLHRTLNLCTNSLQYSMVFDIVNNLLLYVEPQQKERFERNRVGLSLLDERELRQAILRDQETLRGLVNTQRVHERELWAALRLFDRSLHAAHSGSPPSSASTKQILTPASCLSPSTSAAINAASSRMPPALASQAEQILAFEERIGQLKASIVEKNSLLSQSIAHFQKVHVQSQRLQGGQSVVMAGADPTGGRQREILPISGCNTNNTEGKTGLPITLRSSSASTTSPAASGATTAVGASVGISGAVGNSGAESSPEATATEVEAEVVRRDEVCFEHARWRMTEADGQIGLADVELRGFLYARTHGRDDSGSHWLQLGSMRVHSLAPNSFYKEVLLPDCGSSYHHIGGPMIRVACTQRPPVGGISVKEVMEISVAPLVLQVSKPFYNQLMPFFFPERGNEEGSSSTTAEQADTLDPSTPGSADFIASSEDLHDGVESWLKRRNRQGSKIISRLDPKTWSGRLLSHSGRHYSHRHQHQQRKAVAEETVLEEGVLEVNPTVEQSERGGSAGPTSGPELSLLPLDVMRERARRNHVFLYIKIPGFPIRLSYKGDKQKNLADVTNFELNIPMLEYHNRLWTWLDFVLEVKMRIRRQLIKEVIKQKLRPRRALSWHMARPTSSDRVSAVAAEAADTRVEEEMSLEGHFHSNNSSAPLTASNTLAASNRREQEILKLILGRHAAEHPQQPSGRRRFRVFR